MKLLILSDTQTERYNLEESEIILDKILKAAEIHKPDAIIHAGDIKNQYDLVPFMVINFWVHAVKKIKDAGFRFIALKGNHDRISQSMDSKDWFDILKVAGAETINSTPAARAVGDGYIYFIPYTPSKKQELEWAEKSASMSKKENGPNVLFLHTEIQGVVMNATDMIGKGITPEELHLDSYDACFSGHIHLRQRLADNCWYIGSPFCHSWNEANCKNKGFLLADIKQGQVKIKVIPSGIPGWYDADWLEQSNYQPEDGAYIRSKLLVTNKKITDQIRAEELKLKNKYGKARIFVVPQLEKSGIEEIQLTGNTDKEKIEQYVSLVFPEQARFKPKVTVSYLLSKLETMGQSSPMRQIRMLSATGSNVLCFPEIEVEYDQQGLILIQGRNNDWVKRSNGSGKSSLLGLAPLALFGKTLKEQTHDSWAGEYTDKTARIVFTFKNEKNEKIEIERTRRPHSLLLRVNDKDSSTGIKGTGKNETQGEIEKLLGYDFQAFINAVYIDNSIANSFLFGTQKERMDLINRFLNLERYDVALKSVNKDIEQCDKAISKVDELMSQCEDEREELEINIKEFSQQVETDWASKHKKTQAEVDTLQKELTSILGVESTYQEMLETIDAYEAEEKRLYLMEMTFKAQLVTATKEKQKYSQLVDEGKCSYCGQSTEAFSTDALDKIVKQVNEMKSSLQTLGEQRQKIKEKNDQLKKKHLYYENKKNDVTVQLSQARKLLLQAAEGAEKEKERNEKLKAKVSKYQLELKLVQRRLTSIQATVKRHAIDMEMLLYCKKAFSRSGIPLLLCQQLCPILNQASDYYGELFFEGRQKVRYSIADEEFQVEVFNTAGSQEVKGQSTGEAAMAGIICAMALREAAPKTNVLILDEPGAGLDPEGARSFAKGLLELKKHFGTILVTTHHPSISSTLEGETTWTVEKTDGISKLLHN